MQQARSRLQRAQELEKTHEVREKKTGNLSSKGLGKWLSNSFRYIPTLLTSLFFYGALATMMHFVHPTQIQNWLFPKSYLSFHFLLALGNFFFFTFLFQRKFLGWVTTICIGWLLFLSLQNINLDFWAVGSALVLSLFSGLWYSLIQRWDQNKKEV